MGAQGDGCFGPGDEMLYPLCKQALLVPGRSEPLLDVCSHPRQECGMRNAGRSLNRFRRYETPLAETMTEPAAPSAEAQAPKLKASFSASFVHNKCLLC